MTRRFWFGSFGALLLLAAIGTTALLAGMALAGKEAQAPAGSDRSVVLSYRFTVRDLPRDAAKARIWIPLPAENSHQRLRRFDLKGGHRYQLVTDAEYGNRFLRLDLPASELSGKGESQIALDFDVTRKAYRVEAGAKAGDAVPKELLKRFLSPDRLVPIDGQISKEARRVAGDARSPLERARRLYDHIVASMRYDKSGTEWGRGDALWACDARKGNCTDFHSLFIGEARALLLPARFIMGVPLPEASKEGAIPGYHCWAEFYLDGMGWVPVDASEANKHPEKKEDLFAGLDANRIQFTTGRDIKLPDAAEGLLNYSIYPYVEVDGRPHPKVETSLSFKEVGEETRSASRAGPLPLPARQVPTDS